MKIDVSQIDGYAEMSVEDKLKALEAFEMPEPDFTGYVKKEHFDKTASELAAKKKELREKLSEDEAAKADAEEKQAQMLKELNELRRESQVAKNKAKLIGLGYDETLAEETAFAMADGNIEKVFVNQKKHLDTFEKRIRAEALKNTPKPIDSGDSETMTLEKLKKLSPAERLEYSQQNPESYRELYGGQE